MNPVISEQTLVEVIFNNESVVSYHRMGDLNHDEIDQNDMYDSEYFDELVSGEQRTLVYRVKLRPNPKTGSIASVSIKYKGPGFSSDEIKEEYNFSSDKIKSTYNSSSKDFKLAASAASYCDYLVNENTDFAKIEKMSVTLKNLYAGDKKVKDFTGMVYKTGRKLEK